MNGGSGSVAACRYRISSTAALEGKAASQTAETLIFDGQLTARSSRWLSKIIVLSKVLTNCVKSFRMLGIQELDKLETIHPVHCSLWTLDQSI